MNTNKGITDRLHINSSEKMVALFLELQTRGGVGVGSAYVKVLTDE